MTNKYEDKIYFLEDILDEMENDGYHREMVKQGYLYYMNKLREDIATTENVAYQIGTLGVFHLTLPSLKKLQILAQKRIDFPKRENAPEEGKKYLEIIQKKIDKIEGLNKRIKELGIKNNPFYKKRYNPRKILND